MHRSLRLMAAAAVLVGLSSPAAALEIIELGATGAAGQDGESVTASGSEVVPGDEAAEVSAFAQGGDGGVSPGPGLAAGDGGGAALGTLYAASETGSVSVRGTAQGGAGGQADEGDSAGSGASVRLRNRVDGDTAGKLVLSQGASGGRAGSSGGSVAGAAVTYLDRRKSAESLELRSRAIGGGTFDSSLRRAASVDGGLARASARAANDAGSVRAMVAADGGDGGAGLLGPAGDGGDASVVAFGRSEGDDHPVFVGVAIPPPLGSSNPRGGSPPPVPSGARGGGGGTFQFIPVPNFERPPTPPAGNGGHARSISIGIAEGNSPVEVRDTASGGGGGFQVGVAAGGLSQGGTARSVALAVGHGDDSSVKATALAFGGRAGTLVPGPGDAGEPVVSALEDGLAGAAGVAKAVAIGQASSTAAATAWGGWGTHSGDSARDHPGGAGKATAKALGAWSTAVARASSRTGRLDVQASVRASRGESASVEARAGPPQRGATWARLFSRFLPDRRARNGFVEVTVAPSQREVERSLRRQPDMERALDEIGVDTIEAIGSYTGQQSGIAPSEPRGTQPSSPSFQIVLSPPFFIVGSVVGPVVVGLFAPEVSAVGFSHLRLLVTKGDEVLVERVFSDPKEAEEFLDGALLEVGFVGSRRIGLHQGPLIVSVELAGSGAGSGLSLDFLVGIGPLEPWSPDNTRIPAESRRGTMRFGAGPGSRAQ